MQVSIVEVGVCVVSWGKYVCKCVASVCVVHICVQEGVVEVQVYGRNMCQGGCVCELGKVCVGAVKVCVWCRCVSGCATSVCVVQICV